MERTLVNKFLIEKLLAVEDLKLRIWQWAFKDLKLIYRTENTAFRVVNMINNGRRNLNVCFISHNNKLLKVKGSRSL